MPIDVHPAPSARRFPSRARSRLAALAAALGVALRGAAAEAAAAPAETIRLEAETGEFAGGVKVTRAAKGFSGDGYVAGFTNEKDRVTLRFPARAGLYALTVRYRAETKGFLYEVNGVPLSAKFADSRGEFREQRFGKVALRDGENTLAIRGGWHRYEIDRIDLTPVPALPSLAKPPATPCDPDAIPAARALLSFLVENYGERTLSGAIADEDFDYVQKKTGRLPAIAAGDLMNFTTASIRHAGAPSRETERMIERARAGHIPSYCWHWRSPSGLLDRHIVRPDGTKVDARWYKGFYTEATKFDVVAALAEPKGADHALLLADIDLIAAELRKLDALDIPVLWRPLHEAEGAWFWWGAKGPGPFKQLWRLVHERLTRHHGLHNLIWIYTGTANADWYPGDDVVDLVGIDEYPADIRDPLSPIWDDVQAQFGGKKLIALSEFGGVPDLTAARRLGVTWSYFASWSKELGPRRMSDETLRRIYQDERTINLSDLPKDRWAPRAQPRPRP